MSQYGMQMPGGHIQRGASMNVFTGLLALAVAALIAASAFVYLQGAKLGKDGNAFALQGHDAQTGQYEISLPDK